MRHGEVIKGNKKNCGYFSFRNKTFVFNTLSGKCCQNEFRRRLSESLPFNGKQKPFDLYVCVVKLPVFSIQRAAGTCECSV